LISTIRMRNDYPMIHLSYLTPLVMILSLISNKPNEIKIALDAGIQRVMIDLEKETKIDRQKGKGLFLTDHTINDLITCTSSTNCNCVVVRINSIHEHTKAEIDAICNNSNVQYIMLPYFKSMQEIDIFLKHLPSSVKSILLFENYQSIALAQNIIDNFKIDEAFIGLNDLALSLKYNSIFKIFEEPTIYRTLEMFKNAGIPFGLGGVGNMLLKNLPIQPDLFFLFQLCLGCERGLLSRNFRSIFSMDNWQEIFEVNMEIISKHQKMHVTFSDMDRQNVIQTFQQKVSSLQ